MTTTINPFSKEIDTEKYIQKFEQTFTGKYHSAVPSSMIKISSQSSKLS